MARSFRGAQQMREALDRTKWALFASIARLTDARADAAQRLRRELAEAVAADEYVAPLAQRLPALEDRAISLLSAPPAPVPPPEPRTPPPPAPPRRTSDGNAPSAREYPPEYPPHPVAGGVPDRLPDGSAPVAPEGDREGLDLDRLRTVTAGLEALLARDPAARIRISWEVRGGENS